MDIIEFSHLDGDKLMIKLWLLIRYLSIVDSSFKHGKNFKIGYFNIINKDVIVGDNVKICNFVLLKEDTKIGNNCFIDSYVLSSGSCSIGNNVTLRYQSVIARNVIIKDNVYFTAGVKTIFLNHKREDTVKSLIIGKDCFMGDGAVIMGGVKIASNCIVGVNAFINKDTKPNGVYVGIPAIRLRDTTEEEKYDRHKNI